MSTSMSRAARASFAAGLFAATFGLAASDAAAAVLVYTDQAAFRAAMSSTTIDRFADLPVNTYLAGPLERAGALPYRISAVDQAGYGPGQGAEALYNLDDGAGGTWLGTSFSTSALHFDGFGGAVFGIGGIFFGTDLGGATSASRLTLTVQDGIGSYSYVLDAGAPGAFIGFASDRLIDAFTISAAQDAPGLFATVAALEIGTVPEPGSLALAGLAALGMGLARRRRSR